MRANMTDTRRYTLSNFRYQEDGQWKEGMRSVPNDMAREDIVTRFLFWLEEKMVAWRIKALEATPLVRGIRSELDKNYADIAAQRATLKAKYPKDYAEAEQDREDRFSYLRYVDELR